ncbi:tyrosine-type recombinase/integrase [Mycobacterium sp.]|uniref:tyrosine-type recombinase/integrase n=1 Tax=Mycobacterium sp. TaxID=1785 RepID=UPI003BAEEDE1
MSGLLPPSPAPPGSGCPQLRCPAATGTTAKVSHLHSNLSASRRTHDLRHTFATLQLGNQQPIKIVSEMMGHTRTAITQDLYTHVSAQMQRRAADALDAVLRTNDGDVEAGSIDGGA